MAQIGAITDAQDRADLGNRVERLRLSEYCGARPTTLPRARRLFDACAAAQAPPFPPAVSARFRLTAWISARGSTWYNSAKSRSRMTFWPRTTWIRHSGRCAASSLAVCLRFLAMRTDVNGSAAPVNTREVLH